MSDMVGNPNCWFSHAQAQLRALQLHVHCLYSFQSKNSDGLLTHVAKSKKMMCTFVFT